MSNTQVSAVIQWGNQEIKGPVHLFRERMIIDNLRKHLHEGRILDAGCGTGSLALELGLLGYTVLGVDSSLDCVRAVRQKAAKSGLSDRVMAYQGDVAALGLGHARFDGIVCGEVLEHLCDDRPAVKVFNHILREEGVCVATVPANPKLWSEVDVYAGHVRRYTSTQLSHLFQSHGFQTMYLRHWGFPIIRLYQRFLFRPYMLRMCHRDTASQPQDVITRTGSNGLVPIVLAQIFRIDSLFGRLPWGVGLVLVAKKCTNV
ncbi:methyltransferase domain-containing protein [Candidatus Bathyarchaeota archaeon A05DMB-2]|jgi:SAM-dependent methyltransferase|nr:methyltransferase domain-containing protein [Candidatus Bathyarchaeota archaeon A05DMB-2]